MSAPELVAGVELDALVAEKVFGWRRATYGWIDPDRGPYIEPAPFSTSIASAWLVVEKMRERGFGLILNETPGQYRAAFWRYDGKDGWSIDAWVRSPSPTVTVWAETAPLAICLAALKAVSGPSSGSRDE